MIALIVAVVDDSLSEEEYTDDDKPNNLELYRFKVLGVGLAKRIILFIANQLENVFP